MGEGLKSGWAMLLIAAGASFILSILLTPVVIRFARYKGILSEPKKIRFYLSPRPLLGHVVLFISFYLILAGTFILRIYADEYYYTRGEIERMGIGLFLASLFLCISSTFSDIRKDRGDLEWVYIIVCTLMLYFFGIRFTILRIPFLGTMDLKYFGAPLLIIWVLLLVSIVELLDFFEGAAGALVTLVSVAYALLHALSGKREFFVIIFFAILGGAVAGILPYQTLRRKIIYGKSGNKVLGFIFAAGTVISHRKETTGQFVIFPVALVLFIIVVVNFLFLDQQLRPLTTQNRRKRETAGPA